MRTQSTPNLAGPVAPLDYARPASWAKGRRLSNLVLFLIFAGVTAVMIGVLLPSLNRSRYAGGSRTKCASNLRTIGQAIQMYASKNRSAFPPDFGTLLLTQGLPASDFVCDNTEADEPATGATPAAVAAQLTAGGHLSYVYTGRGMNLKSPAGAVVAYEPLDNHGGGSNVLFADFSVQWLYKPAMERLKAELDAGHNPPRPEELK